MEFKTWLESSGIESVLSEIEQKHPGAVVSAYETGHKIELTQIKVPEGARGQGVGTDIVKSLQDYARSVGKPIVIRPAADKGRKADLNRFYRRLGFVQNKGRNMDYTLSSPTASTMYWQPLKENYMGSHRPPGKHYGAPLYDLTKIYPDDVYENIFQYMSDHSQRDAAIKVLRYRNKPEGMVEIYRAVPRGVATINPGDWVAMTKGYAQLHARHPNDPDQDMDVISAEVRAENLYNDGNSMEEWGYWGERVEANHGV
jgi:predicted GNAT family acetyltransferase